MDVESDLARRLLEAHPVETARSLEGLPVQAVASFLEGEDTEDVGRALSRVAPHAAAAILTAMTHERAGRALRALGLDFAALCLRTLDEPARAALVAELPAARARALASMLRFPEHTAGALMDPEVLALPQDLTVREALARVREAAESARYNLYVVDRDHVLLGVVNLRELLLARPRDLLQGIMRRDVWRLSAGADRRAIVRDPGWRVAHALPVVDGRGVYLGAIRYRTLRRLEEELRGAGGDAHPTSRALGALLRASAAGVLEAVSSSTGAGPARRMPHGS